MRRQLACGVDELPPGSSVTLTGEPPIAVFRTEDGEIYATQDSCTHEQWSLGEDGDLEGGEVVCPLHMARFDLRTGKPLCLPAIVALRTYEVEVADGSIYVLIDDDE